MSEIEKLIQQVLFFCDSDDNRCWPTVKRWTMKEAKEALLETAKRARSELVKRS